MHLRHLVRGGLLAGLSLTLSLAPAAARAANAPTGETSITSNFNGTPIKAGSYIWFNAHVSVSGVGNEECDLVFENQSVVMNNHGKLITVPIPDGLIEFRNVTTASTYFDDTYDVWVTTVPVGYHGNIFISGEAFKVSANLPGGISPVSWCGQFCSDCPGVCVDWQWSAAVYKCFTCDLNKVGAKPVDDGKLSCYHNSDHAGTPECWTIPGILPGGARGGGGSNWTGSWSATGHVCACCCDCSDEYGGGTSG